MNTQTARNQFALARFWPSALVCTVVGGLVFQFWGNATRGYIHSRSLFYWWGVQWFDPAAELQHGPLVLLVAGWLFWRNLRIQNGATVSSGNASDVGGNWTPVAAMLAGLLLHLAGYAMQQTRVSIVGLLVFVLGVLTLAGGRRWGRAAIFPLGFMLLALPVNFLDTLGFNLRLTVSEQAFALAKWFGVGLVRNGTQLVSADGRFQYDVAAACSGVRSLVALLALALLLGYLGFRSWWARAILAVMCLPYVVAGNIARVLFLVLVGEKFGATAGSRLHESSGVVVFLVVLGLLLATGALLRRLGFAKAVDEGSANASPAVDSTIAVAEAPSPSLAAGGAAWRIPVVVAAAGLVAAGAMWLDGRPKISTAGVRLVEGGGAPVELPDFIGTDWAGRDAVVSAVEREVLPPDTGYSRKNYVALADRWQQVFVSVVLSGQDRTSIHRPEICLAGQGWSIADRVRHEFRAGDEALPATLLRIEHDAMDARGASVKVRSLLAYWFVSGNDLVPTHAGMQWRDALSRLRHLRAERWAYVVVQSVVGEGGEPAALARMQQVVAGVWPSIRANKADEISNLPAPAKKD
ncbi:MAG: EpsI family protein [Nibricoccus sp.]